MDLHSWVMRLYLLLGILALCIAAAADEIANDVVSDYAQVKELLGQYYRRAARRYGSDYDPKAVFTASQLKPFNDGTEASVNRRMWGEVFENDIILTLPQAEQLLKEQGPRGKRQAQPTPGSFWPNLTISYQFAHTDSTWQSLIRSALRHVESQTCMRFIEDGQDRDRLQFIRGSGCWSNVGKVGGRQQVSIGYGCDSIGIIAHETLHALGLWHEQSRTDRDDFISINSDYIIRGTQGNFAKRTIRNSDNMGQNYDLGSIMHYGPKAFSTDWSKITIKTRDEKYQQTIGQREGISFKDSKMINLRYCQAVCPYQLRCQNEGYTDPHNCGQCKCPSGYGGTYCDRVEYTPSCGGEIYVKSYFEQLESGFVSSTSNCVWRLKAPAGARIEMIFDKVSFLCRDTCKSYVEVKYLQSKATAGARLCCNAPSGSVFTEGDDAILIFKGEPDLPYGYHGFTVKFRTYRKRRSTGYLDGTTPEPLPTVPPTTTTEVVTTTPTTETSIATRSIISGEWGHWGDWSQCSRQCGGCGVRRRVRGCYGGNGKCTGEFLATESCNIQECASSTRGNVCNGRIMLPCDMVRQLEFGAKNNDALPIQRSPKRSRRSLRTLNDQELCEKKFTYFCPTGLLTIHIDWRRSSAPAALAEPNDTSTCCSGYYASGGNCYQA